MEGKECGRKKKRRRKRRREKEKKKTERNARSESSNKQLVSCFKKPGWNGWRGERCSIRKRSKEEEEKKRGGFFFQRVFSRCAVGIGGGHGTEAENQASLPTRPAAAGCFAAFLSPELVIHLPCVPSTSLNSFLRPVLIVKCLSCQLGRLAALANYAKKKLIFLGNEIVEVLSCQCSFIYTCAAPPESWLSCAL